MKLQSAFSGKVKKGTYDPQLDKLEDMDLFPVKDAMALETLKKAKIPERRSASLNSAKD